MTLTLDNLLCASDFERARAKYAESLDNYYEAVEELENAKTDLEFKKALKIVEGVEGSNAEQREAKLKQALETEYAHVQTSESILRQARNDLEQAKLVWDCLRYKLRLLEAVSTRGAA